MQHAFYIAAVLMILALVLAAWMYGPRRQPVLFGLRAVSLFFLLLFLWNPRFLHRQTRKLRPVLRIVQDVSASQAPYMRLSDSLADYFVRDKDLAGQFEMSKVYFAGHLYERKPDSLPLETSLWRSLTELNAGRSGAGREAWILLTDGLQTSGKDYAYMARFWKNLRIYPVVLGDTVRHPDLRVDQPEYNKETGKGNIFPVNAAFHYEGGRRPVETEITVREKGRILKREKVRFDARRRYVKKHWQFMAGEPGWHTYVIEIRPFPGEKNTKNNRAVIRFRVVDRKAKVLILYGGLHPDAGTVRRLLEKEKNYAITVAKKIPAGETYDLIIAVQPTATQITAVRKAGKPVWWITGLATDWTALNREAGWFGKRKGLNTPVEYFPVVSSGFHLFRLPAPPDFPLPPLRDVYGRVSTDSEAQTIWYGRLEGDTARMPLMVIHPQRYEAATFGQGLWRWYMQEKKNTSSDRYMQALISRTATFLMRKPNRGLLQVDHQKHYAAGEKVIIKIRALNTLYEPRPGAALRFELQGPDGKKRKIPLYYENGVFKAYLDSLAPGFYRYTVFYKDYHIKRYGGFEVDAVPLERRLRGVDTLSLQSLAASTDGNLFYPSQAEKLRGKLLHDPFFKPRLESRSRRVPLTERTLWLWLAVLLFTAEWVLRKLKGKL